jgi:hypothetical protein
MTARKTTVLRTAFSGDVFQFPQERGDALEITASGVEVPTTEVDKIRSAAAAAGVALYEVPQDEPPVGNKTEGGNA